MDRRVIRLVALAAMFVSATSVGAQVGGGSGSSGCELPAKVAAGTTESLTLTVGGLEREYRLHVPAGYDPAIPTPVVLNIHGYGGSGANIERYTSLSSHADANGYVIVYPQSTSFTAQDGSAVRSWNDLAGSTSSGPSGPICTAEAFDYPTPTECGEAAGPCAWASCNDDISFIAALLDELEANYCVDTDRVFASGMSNGAMFVHQLACTMPERFAAVAPVAGTLARGYNCAPSAATPVSLMNIYGVDDRYVDLENPISSDGYYYTSAADVLAEWAKPEAQQCSEEASLYATSRDGDLELTCSSRAACASGAEVVNCTFKGGHTWPGEGVANDVIWEFFAKNGRSRRR